MKYKLLIGLVTLLSVVPVSAKVYKWVDENGQVHYSDTPQRGAETVNVRTGEPADPHTVKRLERLKELSRQYDSERQEAEKKQAKAQQQAAKQEAACDAATKRYNTYRQHTRWFTTDSEGNKKYLSDKEYEQSIQEAKQAMKKACG